MSIIWNPYHHRQLTAFYLINALAHIIVTVLLIWVVWPNLNEESLRIFLVVWIGSIVLVTGMFTSVLVALENTIVGKRIAGFIVFLSGSENSTEFTNAVMLLSSTAANIMVAIFAF